MLLLFLRVGIVNLVVLSPFPVAKNVSRCEVNAPDSVLLRQLLIDSKVMISNSHKHMRVNPDSTESELPVSSLFAIALRFENLIKYDSCGDLRGLPLANRDVHSYCFCILAHLQRGR